MPEIWQPTKVATPLTAAMLRPPVQFRPAIGVRAMEAVEVVTTLFQLSSTLTTGCGLKLAPAAAPPGWVVNTSSVAVPGVMVKELLVTERLVADAVRV